MIRIKCRSVRGGPPGQRQGARLSPARPQGRRQLRRPSPTGHPPPTHRGPPHVPMHPTRSTRLPSPGPPITVLQVLIVHRHPSILSRQPVASTNDPSLRANVPHTASRTRRSGLCRARCTPGPFPPAPRVWLSHRPVGPRGPSRSSSSCSSSTPTCTTSPPTTIRCPVPVAPHAIPMASLHPPAFVLCVLPDTFVSLPSPQQVRKSRSPPTRGTNG